MIPKVSIILPVYNAGIYFDRCLRSLVNQTLRDIEIIIVLDCPTDGSDLIAIDYAKIDERIKIIRNERNLHIGLSRNEGLKLACGEYVGFCDHDDYLELDMYEELYNRAINSNSDIVLSGFCYVKEDLEIKLYPSDKTIDKKIILQLLIGRNNESNEWSFFSRNGGIWNKIFKRSLIEDNHIRFVDNRTITFEDLLFQIICFSHVEKIDVVNKVFYYHVLNISNTSSSYSYYNYKFVIRYLDELYSYLHVSGLWFDNKMRFYDTVVHFVIISFLNEWHHKSNIFRIVKLYFAYRKISYVKVAFKSIPIEKTIFNLKSYIKRIIIRILYVLFKY